MLKVRLLAYRAAGGAAIYLFAWPFYALDRIIEWLSTLVTILCAVAAMPAVTFSDWCIDRHNALISQSRKVGRK